MSTNKNSLEIKLIQFFLSASVALILFAISIFLLSFIFFWGVDVLQYQSFFNNLPQWQLSLASGIVIFILMSISLFIAENWLYQKLDTLLNNIGSKQLLALSAVFLIITILAYYFGFSQLINFLYEQFWT
jgi:hypothetical protein